MKYSALKWVAFPLCTLSFVEGKSATDSTLGEGQVAFSLKNLVNEPHLAESWSGDFVQTGYAACSFMLINILIL